MPVTSEVLTLLRKKPGQYISGTELSRRLSVSRTAVWKHIHQLGSAGYAIEAVPHVGYRLLRAPDRLLPDEIETGLRTRRLGKKIFCYESTTSTNDRALQLAADGLPEGTLVAAEHQTRGRGRRDRSWWSSSRRNLMFSIIFRPPWVAEQASRLTLMMAAAVAAAIQGETGLEVRIKWPNDILLNQAKVAGILTEMQAQADRIAYAVCGVGINVNSAPTRGVRYPAQSLAKAAGKPVSRLSLLRRILHETDRLYTKALRSSRPVLDAWRKYAGLEGARVRVSQPDGHIWSGWVLGVDENGSLRLRLAGGELKVLRSGEINRVLTPGTRAEKARAC